MDLQVTNPTPLRVHSHINGHLSIGGTYRGIRYRIPPTPSTTATVDGECLPKCQRRDTHEGMAPHRPSRSRGHDCRVDDIHRGVPRGLNSCRVRGYRGLDESHPAPAKAGSGRHCHDE